MFDYSLDLEIDVMLTYMHKNKKDLNKQIDMMFSTAIENKSCLHISNHLWTRKTLENIKLTFR